MKSHDIEVPAVWTQRHDRFEAAFDEARQHVIGGRGDAALATLNALRGEASAGEPHDLVHLGRLFLTLDQAFEQNPQTDCRLAACLHGAALLEQAIGRGGVAPDAEERLIRAYYRIGVLQRDAGERDNALAAFRAAARIVQRLAAGAPESAEWASHLVCCHEWIGHLLDEGGDCDGALAQFESSLKFAEQLLALTPERREYAQNVARISTRIGAVRTERGELGPAFQALDRSWCVVAPSYFVSTLMFEEADSLANCYMDLADAHLSAEMEAGALQAARGARALLDLMSTRKPVGTNVQLGIAWFHSLFGHVAMNRRDYSGALRQYRIVFEIDERLAELEPGNCVILCGLAIDHLQVGDALRKLRDRDGASIAYANALRVAADLGAAFPDDPAVATSLADSHYSIGRLHREAGDRSQARACGKAARAVLDGFMGWDNADAAQIERRDWLIRAASRLIRL